MNRRPNVVAAHSLDHVSFDVPDLAEAAHFYGVFGLQTARVGDALHVTTTGESRPWLILHAAKSKKKLRYLSFGIFEDDLPRFHERATSLGIASIESLRADSSPQSLWLRDADGTAIELRAAPKRTPNEAPARAPSLPRQDRSAPLRSSTKPVKPSRLSHALLFTPDLATSTKFYADMIGLRLSDDAGAVAFMHAPHGSDHHTVAFAHSKGPGLHHVSWVVSTLEEVGLGAMQMGEAGFHRGWGVGRHVLGSNYFYYVRDPWGSFSEYSFDIDQIPATLDWPASKQSPEDGFYLWGPPPPPDFTTNFEHDAAPDLALAPALEQGTHSS